MIQDIEYQLLEEEAPPKGLESLPVASKIVIEPDKWASFGTYLTVPTRLSVENQSSTVARFYFRTDNDRRVTVECPASSTVHVIANWQAWILYVKNQSTVNLIVWTGEDK